MQSALLSLSSRRREQLPIYFVVNATLRAFLFVTGDRSQIRFDGAESGVFI